MSNLKNITNFDPENVIAENKDTKKYKKTDTERYNPDINYRWYVINSNRNACRKLMRVLEDLSNHNLNTKMPYQKLHIALQKTCPKQYNRGNTQYHPNGEIMYKKHEMDANYLFVKSCHLQKI